MEGASCSNGHGRLAGFQHFSLQELQKWDSLSARGKANYSARRGGLEIAKKRVQVPQAEARGYNSSGYGGNGRVGFKDIYRRRDAEDEYRSGERSLQTSRDAEMKSREYSGDSRDRRNSVVELASHVETITSVQNPYVKHLVKLRQNTSYRNASGCVLVIGSVPLREICDVLTRGSESLLKPIKVLLVLELTNPRSDLSSWSERIVYVSEPVMRKVAGVDSTEGLQGVGVLALPSSFCNLDSTGDIQAGNWVSSPRRVLVLDGIQDPGNLGTLLRTAAAFAWDAVFMLPGGCDPFNEKALRASRGASFRLPIAAGRWSQLQSFACMHKMTLYAAHPDEENDPEPASRPHVIATDTETLDTLGLEPESKRDSNSSIAIAAGKEALCLILGNEGQGLSENAHRSCERVSISMPGHFESLNVAVAGGILLYLLNN